MKGTAVSGGEEGHKVERWNIDADTAMVIVPVYFPANGSGRKSGRSFPSRVFLPLWVP